MTATHMKALLEIFMAKHAEDATEELRCAASLFIDELEVMADREEEQA